MEAAPGSGFSFIHNLESNIYANSGLVMVLILLSIIQTCPHICRNFELPEEELAACTVFLS